MLKLYVPCEILGFLCKYDSYTVSNKKVLKFSIHLFKRKGSEFLVSVKFFNILFQRKKVLSFHNTVSKKECLKFFFHVFSLQLLCNEKNIYTMKLKLWKFRILLGSFFQKYISNINFIIRTILTNRVNRHYATTRNIAPVKTTKCLFKYDPLLKNPCSVLKYLINLW